MGRWTGLAFLPPQGLGKSAFPTLRPEDERVEAVLSNKSRICTRPADQILAASPQLIDPRCPYFQRFGRGCHYQHTVMSIS